MENFIEAKNYYFETQKCENVGIFFYLILEGEK